MGRHRDPVAIVHLKSNADGRNLRHSSARDTMNGKMPTICTSADLVQNSGMNACMVVAGVEVSMKKGSVVGNRVDDPYRDLDEVLI
ncbi:hypothetical protein [Sinorhizobium meliloti]|uniref:hypothetical protein n=1 Tax=Rhizobium meliloti TaxID=382 RepID=UPI001F22E919|nr:hypothetical protein [Sinorhizobium meliloti]